MSYTQIKSPIDGRIGQAAYSPGNLVGPNSGVLATVVKEDPIQVVFNVSQRQLIEARRDVPKEQLDAIVARLRLADGSTYDQPGKLDFVGVQADPNTDSIPLRAVFPNPKGVLADGMSVRVMLEIGKPVQALVIPQSAIAQDQAGTYVFVVDAQEQGGQASGQGRDPARRHRGGQRRARRRGPGDRAGPGSGAPGPDRGAEHRCRPPEASKGEARR